MAQHVPPLSCSTSTASTSVGKGIIEIRNGQICVRHNLSDILKVPPIDDMVVADGGDFLGGNGIIKNKSLIEWPT